MKKLLLTSVVAFICSCTFISCSDTENVNADMDKIINDYIYRTVEITIDGEKAELPGWALSISNTVSDEDQKNSIFGIKFNHGYNIAGRFPAFRVSASLSGSDVIFSGDDYFNTPEYQMSVKGKLIQKDSATDIWQLDIRRTALDKTPLVGNTFLMKLDADAVTLDDFSDKTPFDIDGEEISAMDYIRQYPLPFYFNCLHETLGCTALKLTFWEDNQVTIEGMNEQTGESVPFEGEYRYFLKDSKTGYIEMSLDSELAHLYKSLGRNKEVEREEWRNAAYASFELEVSAEGEILFSLDSETVFNWVQDYYSDKRINEKEYKGYSPIYWWESEYDKIWIRTIKLN